LALLFPSGPLLGQDEFRLIREFINDFCGLELQPENLAGVQRRLGERVNALRLGSFREYYHYLRYHPQRQSELELAVDALTTNETYFFREQGQLQAFSSEVLPELRERAASRRSLTLWSAGCSTGEEVYTLAILIQDSGLFADWDVRVFGNDISRRVLQVARRGLYRETSFRVLPARYAGYFATEREGRVVDPKVRAMCHFGHFNLLDPKRASIVGRVDAVFCRNVLIYFDTASRRRVIETFYDRLYPGGYLMLGHSESLLHLSTAFELAHLNGDLAYRKPNSGGLR
jgi:chemotaxis protein methyltransferase CheR